METTLANQFDDDLVIPSRDDLRKLFPFVQTYACTTFDSFKHASTR